MATRAERNRARHARLDLLERALPLIKARWGASQSLRAEFGDREDVFNAYLRGNLASDRPKPLPHQLQGIDLGAPVDSPQK
jgi:hypothetical protein